MKPPKERAAGPIPDASGLYGKLGTRRIHREPLKTRGREWTRCEQHFRNRKFALPAAWLFGRNAKVRLYETIFCLQETPLIAS